MVNFILAGVQKSGTTLLANLLNQHSKVFIPPEKELHFFDDETIPWDNQTLTASKYLEQFKINTINDILLGDATPIYCYWQPCMQRIWNYNPHMRIVLCLRNPVERAFSHWTMENNRGWDSLTFREAIKQEDSRCREALPLQHRVYSYVSRGFYSEQLRRLWHFFPKSQTLILRHDDLANDCLAVLKNIHRFLGLDHELPRTHSVNSNRGSYASSMDSDVRRQLQAIFNPEISQLEQMLDWDLSSWRSDLD